MPTSSLPVGKLPPELLSRLLATATVSDPDVIVGPGVGLDCAVVSVGDHYLVFKSDPVTFVTDNLGWYLVHVNANDLATSGATPRWMLVTLLLPEGSTDDSSILQISDQINRACLDLDISVVGGHTEVTYGLGRVLALGTMIGVVAPERLVTPRGVQPGDKIIVTKGVPIEATAILAREFEAELRGHLTDDELSRAANFLFDPGISVVRDAQVALSAGRVHAMHDATEGGLAAALWEMAEASQKTLVVDRDAVPVPALSAQLCAHFGFDPLDAIASGALVLAVAEQDAKSVVTALRRSRIEAAVIGTAREGPVEVWQQPRGQKPLQRPQRDAVARLFEGVAG
jgi:hydrogenase maturation factor